MRFDERDQVFVALSDECRGESEGPDSDQAGQDENIDSSMGMSELFDGAQERAARSVEDLLINGYKSPSDQRDNAAERLSSCSQEDLTERVREAALAFGADLVGVAKLNRDWLFSNGRDGRPVEIPESYSRVLVMAVAMDPSHIRKSPGSEASAETSRGYARMAYVTCLSASFIRVLGYDALPCGNGTALSIPMAVDAGLGYLSRNGMLTTEEYGSCVRLCKVLTDMPLVPDRRRDGTLRRRCESCRLCAKSCPAGAISSDPSPSYRTHGSFNSSGVLRWTVDHEKCYRFWVRNGRSCSSCIAVCPETPR